MSAHCCAASFRRRGACPSYAPSGTRSKSAKVPGRSTAASPPSTRLPPRDCIRAISCRIVRALEVEALTGRPISAWQDEHRFASGGVDALMLGCRRTREELAARIEARCDAMLAAGLLDEIRDLWTRGYGPELPALQSVGYREMGAHLRGECDRSTARAAFARATRRLAKRQRAWFRAEASIEWFHPDRDRAALLERAAAWLERPWPSPTSISSSLSPR